MKATWFAVSSLSQNPVLSVAMWCRHWRRRRRRRNTISWLVRHFNNHDIDDVTERKPRRWAFFLLQVFISFLKQILGFERKRLSSLEFRERWMDFVLLCRVKGANLKFDLGPPGWENTTGFPIRQVNKAQVGKNKFCLLYW